MMVDGSSAWRWLLLLRVGRWPVTATPRAERRWQWQQQCLAVVAAVEGGPLARHRDAKSG